MILEPFNTTNKLATQSSLSLPDLNVSRNPSGSTTSASEDSLIQIALRADSQSSILSQASSTPTTPTSQENDAILFSSASAPNLISHSGTKTEQKNALLESKNGGKAFNLQPNLSDADKPPKPESSYADLVIDPKTVILNASGTKSCVRFFQLLKTDARTAIQNYAKGLHTRVNYNFLLSVCAYQAKIDKYQKECAELTCYPPEKKHKIAQIANNIIEQYLFEDAFVSFKDKTIAELKDQTEKVAANVGCEEKKKIKAYFKNESKIHPTNAKLINAFDRAVHEVCSMDWATNFFKSKQFKVLEKRYT